MHQYNCDFCDSEMELHKPWDGLMYFKTPNHSHSVTIMVMRNKHDDSGKVMEAITKPICLNCLKGFTSRLKELSPK